MGPLFFRADDERINERKADHALASLGPFFFRRDDQIDAPKGYIMPRASMGPLFFRADDGNVVDTDNYMTIQLQWGRSSSERMTGTRPTDRFSS